MKRVRCFTFVNIYHQKVETKNLLYAHLYKYTCQSSLIFQCVCRKYWKIVQRCYWLLDSFNHNRITRLKTIVIKKCSYLSAIVTHIISGDIISPRQGWKLSQIPHIRDSKFCTTRIIFTALQVKCDTQARKKYRTAVKYVNICVCGDSVKINFEITTRRNWGKSRSARHIWWTPEIHPALCCLCRILINKITGKVKQKLT